MTLCLVYDKEKILLGMKKRGFGEGRWNGFGGKVEEGETIEEAAKRELKEEAGISPLDIKKRGVLTFEFRGEPEVLEVHVFSVSKFKGKPAETEEMKPRWFKTSKVPFDKMWPDDKHWIPILLDGRNFQGKFHFYDNNTLLRYKVREI